MTWAARFTALAESDVTAAYSDYSEARTGLGEEFLADLGSLIIRIGEFPEIGPPVHRELRRALLHRFPYSVYYRLMPAETMVEVRACLHQRQHPRTWRRRA